MIAVAVTITQPREGRRERGQAGGGTQPQAAGKLLHLRLSELGKQK